MKFRYKKISGKSFLELEKNKLLYSWKKLETKKPKSYFKIKIFFLVLFLIFSWAIFSYVKFFGKMDKIKYEFDNTNLEISLIVPNNIIAGRLENISIQLINSLNVNIRNLELRVQYPENFIFIESNPKPSNKFNNIWKFDILETGSAKKIDIKGIFYGRKGEIKNFIAGVYYKPVNIHSTFYKEVKKEIEIKKTAFEIKFLGPKSITQNQDISLDIVYNTNNSVFESKNQVSFKIKLYYPKGFKFISSTPKPSIGTDTFIFNNISDTKKISIKGKINGVVGELKEFRAEIGILRNGIYDVQNIASLILPVVQKEFYVKIDNSSNDLKSQEFSRIIIISNLGDLILTNINCEITIKDEEDVLDKNDVNFSAKNYDKITKDDKIILSFKIPKLDLGEISNYNLEIRYKENPLNIEAKEYVKINANCKAFSEDLLREINSMQE